LDIFPQKPGHTLIVPKVEVDHFSDVPEPYYAAIFQTAKILSPAIQEATGCARVCGLFLGFEVPHCHYHLVPYDGLDGVHWKSVPQASPEALHMIQKQILENLKTL
jgi:histidine triad (HIT) family protein